MSNLIATWLPIIVAGEAALAGVALLVEGKYGSAMYWISACLITVGVIMIPKWG